MPWPWPVAALNRKEVGRILLTRPVVEAGENLGFLPGTLTEKIDPYIRPLYDALFDMMDPVRANKLLAEGVIEIAPLAFMRGRTLNDSFIILDEAQNTTSQQMKMFITRLGMGSKMVITGDMTQTDLPKGISGFRQYAKFSKGSMRSASSNSRRAMSCVIRSFRRSSQRMLVPRRTTFVCRGDG